jgi:prepilin-type N-terminal cleavage/methylation domain-containing protein
MTRTSPPTPRHRSRGFTLVECIIVLVVLAIAATGIAALQGNIFSGQSAVKDLQVRTRIMEECAEQVLAVRARTQDGATGFEEVTAARFGANLCDTVPALSPAYTIPSATVSDYAGTLCPTGGTCKLVSVSQGSMAPLVLLLVDY